MSAVRRRSYWDHVSYRTAVAKEQEADARILNAIICAHRDTFERTSDKLTSSLDPGVESQDQRSSPSFLEVLNAGRLVHMCGSTAFNKISLDPGVESENQRFGPSFNGVVDFYKSIPKGPFPLNRDDEVILLRAGVFEVLLIRLASSFDSRTNTMMSFTGQRMKWNQVCGCPDTRLRIDAMFSFAEKMQKMKLTDAEIALFSAIVLFTPDRSGLFAIGIIERIHNKLCCVLQAFMAKTRQDYQFVYSELLTLVQDLKILNTLFKETTGSFQIN